MTWRTGVCKTFRASLESAALLAEEEDTENQYSQPLIATTFAPVGSVQAQEIDVTKKLERRKLIEALIWLVCLVILWTCNLVLFKKTSTVMVNYSLFLSLIRVAVQLPFYFTGFMIRLHCHKALSKAELAVPLWKFFAMGTLDSLASYLQTFAAGRIAGSLQSLLQQSAIPFTMWIGATIILGGVFLVLWPTLTDPSRTALEWSGVYLLSNVPNALSNLWKEATFKHITVDLWHMQTMVCIGQIVASILLAPLISVFPPIHSPANLPRNMLDSILCVFGHDTYPNDRCSEAGTLLLAFMTVNFVFNLVLLGVLRTSSATVVTLASAFRLPLGNIAFTWVWLMGNLAQPLSFWDWLGLGVILLGLFLYSSLMLSIFRWMRKKFCVQ